MAAILDITLPDGGYTPPPALAVVLVLGGTPPPQPEIQPGFGGQPIRLAWGRSAVAVAGGVGLAWGRAQHAVAGTARMPWNGAAAARSRWAALPWQTAARLGHSPVRLPWQAAQRLHRDLRLPWQPAGQLHRQAVLRWAAAAQRARAVQVPWGAARLFVGPGRQPVQIDPQPSPVLGWLHLRLCRPLAADRLHLVLGRNPCAGWVPGSAGQRVIASRSAYVQNHSLSIVRLPDLQPLPAYSATWSADDSNFGWQLSFTGPSALLDLLAPVGGLPRLLRP